MNQRNIDRKTAKKWIEDTDERRRRLLEEFSGKPFSELLFDLVLNNAAIHDEEIAEMIAGLINKRYQS